MKRIIQEIIKTAGFKLTRIKSISNPSFQLYLGFQKFNIDLVFDIGANIGQFALEVQEIGFSGKIISFEPLSDAYIKLVNASKKNNGKWLVHERCAIGDKNEEIRINISGNSVSSSILPMLEAHTYAAPESSYISSEKTIMRTLDTVALDYINKSSNLFIKIDTQGFEWQVLNGAIEILKVAKGVMLELSLVPLYAGQILWIEMIERLKTEGFTLWSIQNGFTDSKNGKTLQINAIFFRSK